MPRGYSRNFEFVCYPESFPSWSGETAGFDRFVFDSLQGQYPSCRLGVFLHDADVESDGTPKKDHCHVWLHTQNAVSPATVAKRVGLSEKKSVTPLPGHTERGFLPYVVHSADDDKAPYPADRAILTDDFASVSDEKGECATDEMDWTGILADTLQSAINRGVRNPAYVMRDLSAALPASARSWASRQFWQIRRALQTATPDDRAPLARCGHVESMPDSSTYEQLAEKAASLAAAASEGVSGASDVLPASDASAASLAAPAASEGVPAASDVLPPMTPEEIAAACASGRCSLPECDLERTGPAFDEAAGVDIVPGGNAARDRVYRSIDRLVCDIRHLEELSRIYQCSPISASAVASCGQWLADSLSTLSGIAGTSGSAVKTEGGGGLPPFTPLIVPPADRG